MASPLPCLQYARNVDLVSASRGVLWVGVPGCIELAGKFREPIDGLLASLEEATAAGAHVVVGASRRVLRHSLRNALHNARSLAHLSFATTSFASV